ncbi:hypothetical protein [Archangium sp.]|uniref:hypothetical protein n=1 Tax=Archangium sp. TaxID=1872627 RepID=UPI002D34C636|nr:hypothetical protein [Archangium sp.]HYO55837.1 hypothetical protein [Archangium sp.]
MGTEISVVYGGSPGTACEIGSKLAELFEQTYSGYLFSDFAKVRRSSESNVYEFYEEVGDLEGRSDMEQRLRALGSGSFTYELNMGFAPSEAHVMVFESSPDFETTVVITFEKQLTSYLFTSEVTHAPFATVLERIGRTLQASCFVAGANYVRWLPLKPKEFINPQVFGDSPQVVGWREGTVDSRLVLEALGAKREWLEKSLHGYDYVSLLGRHEQREKNQR